jgi:hypothetical protein
MSNLKEQLIKLGNQQKELRPHLRPVLAELEKEAGGRDKLGTLYKQAGDAFIKEVLQYLAKILPNIEDDNGNSIFSEKPVFRASGMALEAEGMMGAGAYAYGYAAEEPSQKMGVMFNVETKPMSRSREVVATATDSVADAAHRIRDAIESMGRNY